MSKITGYFEGRGSYAVCVDCLSPTETRFFNTEEPITDHQWSPEDVDCDRCGRPLLTAGTYNDLEA